MTINENIAPVKTCSRGCRMERIAEIRKVLSPISENIMIANECRSGCRDSGVHDGRGLVVDMD